MCHLRRFRAVASFRQRLLFTTQMQQNVRAVAFLRKTFRDRNTEVRSINSGMYYYVHVMRRADRELFSWKAIN